MPQSHNEKQAANLKLHCNSPRIELVSAVEVSVVSVVVVVAVAVYTQPKKVRCKCFTQFWTLGGKTDFRHF